MKSFWARVAPVAVLSLAGCAADPRDISPAYVSPVNYHNWNCEQLAGEGHRLVAALSDASQRQENARTNDTVAVLLVGLPLGSMSGQNVAPEVARLKGEHEAVYKAAIEKGCATQQTASLN